MPNLKRQDAQSRQDTRSQARCRIGKVKLLAGAIDKTGKVVRQKPRAGKVKAAGTKIAVTFG